MPNDDDEPITLPVEAMAAILLGYVVEPTALKLLRLWLSDVLNAAVRRARIGDQLTMAEVDAVAAAHRRFRNLLNSLQGREDAPPTLPISEGADPWEKWLIVQRHFPPKQGRGYSADWQMTMQLLALYESVSQTAVSAAQPGGPTMRFLIGALKTLAQHAPPDTRPHFVAPEKESLRKRIKALYREDSSYVLAKRELLRIMKDAESE